MEEVNACLRRHMRNSIKETVQEMYTISITPAPLRKKINDRAHEKLHEPMIEIFVNAHSYLKCPQEKLMSVDNELFVY